MHRLWSTLFLTASLAGITAAGLGQQSLFDAAHESQTRGNLPLAEQQYRNFLHGDPRSVPAYTNLGVVLARQGKLSDAIEQYLVALRFDPNSAQARTDLALAYFRSEQWAKASQSFVKVLRGHPDDRRCRQLLALAYMHQNDPRHAAEAFEQLLPSSDPEILIGLSSSYRDLGRTADSDRVLQSFLASQGDSATGLYLLGMADYARGSYPEAVSHLTKSVEIAPAVVEAHFYLGAAYFKLRDFPSTLKEWKLAQGLEPNFFPAVFATGALLIDEHQATEALPFLEHAHTLRPQDGNVQLALAKAEIALGHLPAALTLLRSAVRVLPESQPAYFLLARTLKQLGHEHEAALDFALCRTLAAKDNSSLGEPADILTH